MELYCLGDSLTFGYGVSSAQRWIHLAAQQSGWHLVNLGVPGDTTGGMMARLQTQLMPRLTSQRGGSVMLMGGCNDIFYGGSASSARANMGGMIHQLLTAGSCPIVGSPIPLCIEDVPQGWTTVVDFPEAAEMIAQYRVWCAEYCRAFGIPYIDFYDDFLLPGGEPDRALYLDGLHPTPEGHHLMAKRVAAALAQMEDKLWH